MKKYIVILLLFPLTLCAQPLLKELPAYPFIDYSKNKLLFPGGHDLQSAFYQKLDSLILFAQGNINIVHIGGSHVQADLFSNRMRQNLIHMLPALDADRGTLFPYRVARTNNPSNYLVSYQGKWEKNQNSKYKTDIPLGITGWAVVTDDPQAHIKIKLNRDSSQFWQYNQIKLIATSTIDSIMPLAVIHGDTITPTYSKTEHCYLFQTEQSTDSVLFLFPQPVSGSTLYNISAIIPQNTRRGITYHSLGVNGASVPAWLRCENFQTELAHITPDLVILGIGINDANVPYGKFNQQNFINNYKVLIERIRVVAPNATFLFITNNDAYYRLGRNNRIPNKNGKFVQQSMHQLAKEYGAALWDLYDIMGGLGSMQRWQNHSLANADKIHFTQQGYFLLGDMLYNALITDYLYQY